MSSHSDKFCLRWNDFEANVSHAFEDLRQEKDFLDVTLACDEDQVQAHKVILSACSNWFRKLLQRHQHSHPLLYLKGVKFSDLVSVLNFMYQGEVNIAQDNLNTFLRVAEELQVKGLTQNEREEDRQGRRSSGDVHKPNDDSKKVVQRPDPNLRDKESEGGVGLRDNPRVPNLIQIPDDSDTEDGVQVKAEADSEHQVVSDQNPIVEEYPGAEADYSHYIDDNLDLNPSLLPNDGNQGASILEIGGLTFCCYDFRIGHSY